jgi:hypothetical protein
VNLEASEQAVELFTPLAPKSSRRLIGHRNRAGSILIQSWISR